MKRDNYYVTQLSINITQAPAVSFILLQHPSKWLLSLTLDHPWQFPCALAHHWAQLIHFLLCWPAMLWEGDGYSWQTCWMEWYKNRLWPAYMFSILDSHLNSANGITEPSTGYVPANWPSRSLTKECLGPSQSISTQSYAININAQ